MSVVCVWPYNHWKMSTQQPVESFSGNNSSGHVASASFCLKEEGSYFSKLVFVSVENRPSAAQAPVVNDTELTNSAP